MRGRIIKEIGGSFRGMHIRNIADITPKWKDIRIADIMPNRSDICSTADIPTLSAIEPKIQIVGGEEVWEKILSPLKV